MKNIIKISFLMVLSLMVLAACDSNNEITAPKSDASLNQNMYQVESYSSGSDAKEVSFPLVSGRNLEIGHIFVSNDSKNLYVSYYMHDAWLLRGSYLHVGKETTDIPSDINGNPDPKAFSYISENNRGVASYMHKVPLSELGVRLGEHVLLASMVDVIRVGANGKVAENERLWLGSEPLEGNQWWSFFGYVLRNDPNLPDSESDEAFWGEQGYSSLK